MCIEVCVLYDCGGAGLELLADRLDVQAPPVPRAHPRAHQPFAGKAPERFVTLTHPILFATLSPVGALHFFVAVVGRKRFVRPRFSSGARAFGAIEAGPPFVARAEGRPPTKPVPTALVRAGGLGRGEQAQKEEDANNQDRTPH